MYCYVLYASALCSRVISCNSWHPLFFLPPPLQHPQEPNELLASSHCIDRFRPSCMRSLDARVVVPRSLTAPSARSSTPAGKDWPSSPIANGLSPPSPSLLAEDLCFLCFKGLDIFRGLSIRIVTSKPKSRFLQFSPSPENSRLPSRPEPASAEITA